MSLFQSIVAEIEAAESALVAQINKLGQLKTAALALVGIEEHKQIITLSSAMSPDIQGRIDQIIPPHVRPAPEQKKRRTVKPSPQAMKVEAWALAYFGKNPKTFPRAEIAKKLNIGEKQVTTIMQRLVKSRKLVWNGKRMGSAYTLGARANGALH